jgi:hypothetical protein
MAEKEYQRLTRARLRRAGFFTAVATRSSLWLGSDHLLCIDSTGYGEDYKRFYFRDIQGVTIRKTKRRMIWNVVLGIPLGLCTVVFIIGFFELSSRPIRSDDYFGFLGWGIPFLLLLTGILVNQLRGPSCLCQLRTAVQTEDLPSLSRLPRARKVLDRLRPLIAAAQGQLAPEEIPARLQELVSQESPGYLVDDPNAPPRMIS